MNQLILVTGAGGKSGRTVVEALARRGTVIRALVRRQEHAASLCELGALEAMAGDMTDPEVLSAAMSGVRAVYHICPNVHPREVEIGDMAIEAAVSEGVERFVYHSVLEPAIEEMPHHWLKREMEQRLAASGLPFTVLQPCAYMQNLLAQRAGVERGQFDVPYSVDSRMSVVDLRDVAEAAAAVLTGPVRVGATYALCGPEAISAAGMAETLTRVLGWPVRAAEVGIEEWISGARSAGFDVYAIDALAKMFRWYDGHDFLGSPAALGSLLGRSPTAFGTFARREFSEPVE